MTRRVADLRSQVSGRAPEDSLLREIEDALCDGYVQALAGDAWSARRQERLVELTLAASRPGGASGLHALAREHSEFERRLRALRDELEGLRQEREALRARARDISTLT